ncbi:homoserine O-acetyltransferase [Chitinophagaceae bacterium LB-8]|jgi:homoserine O-acetyltransferase/O-succinyltransferase|uniref:Homoserine O-acetyltransferase n=1 Tax=Paraflavisolibacter caeni TaxID=2982496 RepID=A0A9X2Y0F9_9BACT|nr:homoserine O-acetyltransferase [Paraflavisolibacter caeni]MCU7550788.1 homoserine O-acetyltransferase [Paraflavisolibacter caeni]
MESFHYAHPFVLESGNQLPEITISYHTYGTLNAAKDNVVWICHAFTANSNASDWWPQMIGPGLPLDPERYFIICANILGSCYGTTGPLSTNPQTGKPYYKDFPFITIRDIVNAHILLRQHLGIEKIHLLIGGSIGGYQALEWCLMEKDVPQNLFLLATSSAESAWGIAVHTAQRLAIEADCTWEKDGPESGLKGMKAARAVALLTYRNYEILVQKQSDSDINKTDNFKASSYITYQGDKLVNRFNAYSYFTITKAMDSHNIARGRTNNVQEALQQIKQNTLIIGISSDILCPVHEQEFMAENIQHTQYIEINSAYGHDGFLVETPVISQHLIKWLER